MQPLQKIWRRLLALPRGLVIAALVLAVFGARLAWIRSARPAQLQELAAAYGSAANFYGAPQLDRAGNHLTYVATADVGFGLFLADVATGKKQNVREPVPGLREGDDPKLRVWPWSPDDKTFAYSDDRRLIICEADTGKSIGAETLPSPVSALTWLSPSSFVCLEADGNLHRFEKPAGGKWGRKTADEGGDSGLSLRNGPGTGTGRAVSAARGNGAERAFDKFETTAWWSGATSGPVWLQYEFTGPAWAVSQYKLVSSTADAGADPRDWELLGSNNGTNWTTLDTRKDEAFTARGQAKRFPLRSQAQSQPQPPPSQLPPQLRAQMQAQMQGLPSTPYRFYRLNITATAAAGPTNGARLAEFQLWSPDSSATMSASIENAPNEPAAAAFDGSPATKWFNKSMNPPAWLQYQFGGGAGWALNEYSLTCANDVPGRDPKRWQLQASNDGRSWTVVDTRTNQSFATRLLTKSFTFTNSTPYRLYRLNMLENQGIRTDGLQLAEFDLGLGKLVTNSPGASADFGLGGNPLVAAVSLMTIAPDTIAWGNGSSIWSMNMNSNVPVQLLDLKNITSAGIVIHNLSYSKETGEYLLSGTQNTKELLWAINPESSRPELRALTVPSAAKNGAWLNGTNRWLAQAGDYLLAQKAAGEPAKLLRHAVIDGFAVTPDGKKLFVQGTISNETSAGIWQYDVNTDQLRRVIASDHASALAVERGHSASFVQLPSGGRVNYEVFPPSDAGRNPLRKHPLVIGNSPIGVVLRGAHGRLWIPAVASGEAYVIFLNRPDWWIDMDKWGQDLTVVYDQVIKTLPIDKSQVFLFSVSAETRFASDFIVSTPGPWKGVIFMNPTGLPDFSKLTPGGLRPRMLISVAGGLGGDGPEEQYKRFQTNALQAGVLVDYAYHPGEPQHLIGNTAQLERAKAAVRFVFEE